MTDDTPTGDNFTSFTKEELADMILPGDPEATPKPRRPWKRPAELTEEAFAAILETLAEEGVKLYACESNGFDYDTVRQTIARRSASGDESWEEAWAAAMVRFRESLGREARRRAKVGVKEPVFHLGQVVGYKRVASDRLLELMLKSHDKDLYGTKVEMSGAVDLTGGGLDIMADLSIKAKKAIREIVIADLQEQAAKKALLSPVAED